MDYTDLRRRAVAQGWRVGRTRSGHLRWDPPPGTGHGPEFSASTPSDQRSCKNTQARLRRKGLRLPGKPPLPPSPSDLCAVRAENARVAIETPMIIPPTPDDPRQEVTVSAKICPDCAALDQQQGDPRAGLRPSGDFARHYRTADGLTTYCRTHMSARMSTKKNRRPLTAETPAPAPRPDMTTDAADVLMTGLADLERRLRALEEGGTPASTVPDDNEKEVPEETDDAPSDPVISNSRSLRRWVKGVAREQARLITQVERATTRAEEAVRLAQAAGRMTAQRSPTPIPPDAVPPQAQDDTRTAMLEEKLLRTLEAQIEQKQSDLTKTLTAHVDKKLQAARPASTKTTTDQKTVRPRPITDQIQEQEPIPEGLQEDVLLILARYGNGIKNLARVEHEGLMEKQDIEHTLGRLTSRAVQDTCALVLRYAQPHQEDTPSDDHDKPPS